MNKEKKGLLFLIFNFPPTRAAAGLALMFLGAAGGLYFAPLAILSIPAGYFGLCMFWAWFNSCWHMVKMSDVFNCEDGKEYSYAVIQNQYRAHLILLDSLNFLSRKPYYNTYTVVVGTGRLEPELYVTEDFYKSNYRNFFYIKRSEYNRYSSDKAELQKVVEQFCRQEQDKLQERLARLEQQGIAKVYFAGRHSTIIRTADDTFFFVNYSLREDKLLGLNIDKDILEAVVSEEEESLKTFLTSETSFFSLKTVVLDEEWEEQYMTASAKPFGSIRTESVSLEAGKKLLTFEQANDAAKKLISRSVSGIITFWLIFGLIIPVVIAGSIIGGVIVVTVILSLVEALGLFIYFKGTSIMRSVKNDYLKNGFKIYERTIDSIIEKSAEDGGHDIILDTGASYKPSNYDWTKGVSVGGTVFELTVGVEGHKYSTYYSSRAWKLDDRLAPYYVKRR